MTMWERREDRTGELGLCFTRLTGSELSSRHRRFGAVSGKPPRGRGVGEVLSSLAAPLVPSGGFRDARKEHPEASRTMRGHQKENSVVLTLDLKRSC